MKVGFIVWYIFLSPELLIQDSRFWATTIYHGREGRLEKTIRIGESRCHTASLWPVVSIAVMNASFQASCKQTV